MHIGHEYTTSYAMEDRNRLKNLESTEQEKDLEIVITRDLKSQEQCTQSAKKAQSVLGMVKGHFKVLERQGRLYGHIQDIHPASLRILCTSMVTHIECLERIQRRATKSVKGFDKMKYNDRLKQLGLYTLEK